jgi:type II secretory pathway component PulF
MLSVPVMLMVVAVMVLLAMQVFMLPDYNRISGTSESF